VASDITDSDGNAATTLELGAVPCDEDNVDDEEHVCEPPINLHSWPSPSPSPSVAPIYQMSILANIGLCVSDDEDGGDGLGCINGVPADSFTTRMALTFERVIPSHFDENGVSISNVFVVPPQQDVFDFGLEGMKLYSRRGTELTCWLRDDWNDLGGDDLRHSEYDIDFCENMADWVPTWYVDNDANSYAPKFVVGGQWPNSYEIHTELRDAVSMAVDCRGIMNGAYAEEAIAQSKLVYLPTGTESDGPCWNDPDYGGIQVCANGGLRGSHSNDLYRDIDGNFYPFCSNDFDGPCPRFFTFNCPAGSDGNKADEYFGDTKESF